MRKFKKLNPSKVRDIKNVVQRIFEQYPDPAGLPPRTYDVRNRKAPAMRSSKPCSADHDDSYRYHPAGCPFAMPGIHNMRLMCASQSYPGKIGD